MQIRVSSINVWRQVTPDNINYLRFLAYNWRMVNFYSKVFSQKWFRIKFRFEWYIIWPYLTKFEFLIYGSGAHSGVCPYMDIGGWRKLPTDIFRILHVYRVSAWNSSLASQFSVPSPKQPHYWFFTFHLFIVTALDPCLWNQAFRRVLLNIYSRKVGKIFEKKKSVKRVHFPETFSTLCLQLCDK